MPKQPAIANNSTSIVTVLSVSPLEEDHLSLEAILKHSRWALYVADRVASALAILQEHCIGAVLCERDLQPDTWTDLLQRITSLPDAPPLIVTSPHADERLWSEALNLGAYDVLAKPFDRTELFRSVSLAWLHWRHRRQPSTNRPIAMRAAG